MGAGHSGWHSQLSTSLSEFLATFSSGNRQTEKIELDGTLADWLQKALLISPNA
jgi:hypothetical protein